MKNRELSSRTYSSSRVTLRSGSLLRSKKRFSRKKKVVYFALTALLLIFLAVVIKPGIISEVTVEGEGGSCFAADQIIKESNLVGRHILKVNSLEISQAVRSRRPCLELVEVFFRFPSTAVIRPVFRQKALGIVSDLIASPSGITDKEGSSSAKSIEDWIFKNPPQNIYVADKTGLLFERVANPALPLLYYPEDGLRLGAQLDSDTVAKTVAVVDKVNQMQDYFQPSSTSAQLQLRAKTDDGSLLLNLKPRVIFSLKKDILRQLASLQLILQKAKIDVGKVEVVDLRFDKPVVKNRL